MPLMRRQVVAMAKGLLICEGSSSSNSSRIRTERVRQSAHYMT